MGEDAHDSLPHHDLGDTPYSQPHDAVQGAGAVKGTGWRPRLSTHTTLTPLCSLVPSTGTPAGPAPDPSVRAKALCCAPRTPTLRSLCMSPLLCRNSTASAICRKMCRHAPRSRCSRLQRRLSQSLSVSFRHSCIWMYRYTFGELGCSLSAVFLVRSKLSVVGLGGETDRVASEDDLLPECLQAAARCAPRLLTRRHSVLGSSLLDALSQPESSNTMEEEVLSLDLVWWGAAEGHSSKECPRSLPAAVPPSPPRSAAGQRSPRLQAMAPDPLALPWSVSENSSGENWLPEELVWPQEMPTEKDALLRGAGAMISMCSFEEKGSILRIFTEGASSRLGELSGQSVLQGEKGGGGHTAGSWGPCAEGFAQRKATAMRPRSIDCHARAALDFPGLL